MSIPTEDQDAFGPEQAMRERGFRYVGSITRAEWDQAVEIIASGVRSIDPNDMFAAEILESFHDKKHRSILKHARWVLDRVDRGMLEVVEPEEAAPDA
jgi:hypothetical protein